MANNNTNNLEAVLGDRLSELLNQKGVSLSWLADESGVSLASLSKYRSGTIIPKLDSVLKIAEALGVSVEYLVGYSALPIRGPKVSDDLSAIISAYSKADIRTQKMVQLALEPFMTEREKELFRQASTDEKSENVG